MAAHEKLQSLKGQENIDCSVKYQVLSKLTALIGVMRQKQKSSGEIIESFIQAGRQIVKVNQPVP